VATVPPDANTKIIFPNTWTDWFLREHCNPAIGRVDEIVKA